MNLLEVNWAAEGGPPVTAAGSGNMNVKMLMIIIILILMPTKKPSKAIDS